MIFITKLNLTTSGAQQKAKRSHFETSRQFLATTTNRRNYKIKLDLRNVHPHVLNCNNFCFSCAVLHKSVTFLINHPIFVEKTNFEVKF